MTTNKNTTIFVYTNAKDAVRNCVQHGWRGLQIDLSQWSQEERDLLADMIVEQDGARLSKDRSLANPTPDGLRRHVQDECMRQKAQLEEDKAKLAEELAKLKEKPIEKLLSRGIIYENKVKLGLSLGFHRRKAAVEALGMTLDGPYPQVDVLGRNDEIEQERARKEEERQRQESEQQKICQERRERGEKEHQERRADLRKLLAMIDESLLPRFDADFLPKDELRRALRTLVKRTIDLDRLDLGLAYEKEKNHNRLVTKPDGLTKTQFANFKLLEEALASADMPWAETVDLSAHEVNDFRPATPDDDPDDIDHDGEVHVRKFVFARIEADVCGHTIVVDRLI
jgi:hypothetical protein